MVLGCESANENSDDNHAGFLDEAGFQQEYQEKAAVLELPPGFTYPEKAPSGGADLFEEGCGSTFAEQYWIYAWKTEWLEQRNKDQNREKTAMSILYELPT